MPETDDKKLYELAYFLSPEINESEILNYAETIRKFISESGGKIASEFPPQKKKIGQTIKKFTFGYFGTFNFQSEPAGIDGLKNNLKSEPKILRYMIISKKQITAAKEKPVFKAVKKPKIAETPTSTEKPVTAPAAKPEKMEPEKEKVQMEELNKKLEEILKE